VLGKPLKGATVSITVEDVISQFYLGGDVVTTNANGISRWRTAGPVQGPAHDEKLVHQHPRNGIRAPRNRACRGATESTPAEAKPVRGTAEVNIGFPRVVGRTIAGRLPSSSSSSRCP
jgi:hypothetical protein